MMAWLHARAAGLFIVLLLAIGAFAGGILVGDVKGSTRVQKSWDKEKKAQAEARDKAIAAAVKENAEELGRKYQKLMEVTNGYEQDKARLAAENTKLRADVARAGGLRVSRSICDGFAPGPQTTGAGGDNRSASGSVELPQRTQDDLFALADSARALIVRMHRMKEAVDAAECFEPP